MTNKEAAIWLLNLRADIGKAQHSDLWHYEQALQEIQENLESDVPDTNVGDMISRQAALDAICIDCDCIKAVCAHYPCEKYIRLEQLPSAQQWIPVKTRPMDEEEKRYWEEHYGYTFGEDYDGMMFDCLMPEDGQEIWVCSKCGNVWQDTCEVDEGFGLEGNGDWYDIVAWMPYERPDPWKGEVDG